MKLKTFIVSAAFAMTLPLSANASSSFDGLALSWQNSKGWWFACGPVQCTSVGVRTEEKALDYVTNDDRHGIQNTYQKHGRCHIYRINGMESWDKSANWVRDKSKC